MSLKGLDQYSYQNTLGSSVSLEVPNLNGMTTATVDTFYDWLSTSWQSSSNTCLSDGTPYYREYTQLELPTDVEYSIEKIDLGYEDPDLEGRYFYRVTHTFYEHMYSSSDKFFRWNYEKNKYIHEILYHDSPSSTKEWKRESLPTEPPQYQDINQEPLNIDISVGKALGIKLSSDSPFIYIYDGEESLPTKEALLPLLLKQEITISFKEVSNQLPISQDGLIISLPNLSIPRLPVPYPTYLRMDLYGEKKARSFFHVAGEVQEEEEILKHLPATPFEERLLPPGKQNLNKVFWNYPPVSRPTIENFKNRLAQDTSWNPSP